MCFGLLLARQAYRELGVDAWHAVDLDGAAVLLRHNLVADREAKSSPFARRFRSNERLEQLIPDLWCDAGAVVANPDLDLVAQIPRRDSQHGSIPIRGCLALLVRSVKAIPNQIEEDAR